jgi:hypothetical protein
VGALLLVLRRERLRGGLYGDECGEDEFEHDQEAGGLAKVPR